MSYNDKYLKYKNKYISLKNKLQVQHGGAYSNLGSSGGGGPVLYSAGGAEDDGSILIKNMAQPITSEPFFEVQVEKKPQPNPIILATLNIAKDAIVKAKGENATMKDKQDAIDAATRAINAVTEVNNNPTTQNIKDAMNEYLTAILIK